MKDLSKTSERGRRNRKKRAARVMGAIRIRRYYRYLWSGMELIITPYELDPKHGIVVTGTLRIP